MKSPIRRKQEDAVFREAERLVRLRALGTKGLILAATYLLGTYGFMTAPTTSGPPLGFLGAAYRTLGLFALSADGLPSGPLGFHAAVLWSAYFMAPTVTASALLDAFLTLRRATSAELRIARMKTPLVVCGYGAHGRVLAQLAVGNGHQVVVVDRSLPASVTELRIRHARVPVIHGDMTLPETLSRAGVERALMVWFASGDPLVNLKAALTARRHLPRIHPERQLIPVADEEPVEQLLLETFGAADGDDEIRPFGQFDTAAKNLVDRPEIQGLIDAIGRAERPARIAIVGYGRFGQSLLQALAPGLPEVTRDRLACIEVVDRLATARPQACRATLEMKGWELRTVDTEAEAWVHTVASRPPALTFFCLDGDILNLRLAARLPSRGTETHVVLRLFDAPDEGAPESVTSRRPSTATAGVTAHTIEQLFSSRASQRMPAAPRT